MNEEMFKRVYLKDGRAGNIIAIHQNVGEKVQYCVEFSIGDNHWIHEEDIQSKEEYLTEQM